MDQPSEHRSVPVFVVEVEVGVVLLLSFSIFLLLLERRKAPRGDLVHVGVEIRLQRTVVSSTWPPGFKAPGRVEKRAAWAAAG